jgi:hypothetical protein
MITLVYSAALSTVSLNNGTSKSLSNPSESLNTALLKSSRNPSATSIVISDIKIIILNLKIITNNTVD